MKRLIALGGIITIIFTMTMSAIAGSVPEELLENDNARLYIGRVDGRTTLEEGTLPYQENKVVYIDITPTHVYKGEVKTGVSERFTKHSFGSFIPEKDKEYLFAYIDENNFYIYEITSKDDTTIKLVGSDEHEQTKRLEEYLNDGAFAMAEQERATLGQQISFIEFLYKKPSLSSSIVEKVTFYYQDELYEVDKENFFQIAENIMITNVKNGPLHDAVAKPEQPDPYKTSLYISLIDANGKPAYFGAVSRHGEVDHYGLFMGRLMAKDYEMTREDLSKLYSLLPENVQKEIKAPEGVKIDDEATGHEIAYIPPKAYIGLLAGGALLISAIAFVIGWFVHNRKK